MAAPYMESKKRKCDNVVVPIRAHLSAVRVTLNDGRHLLRFERSAGSFGLRALGDVNL